MWYSHEWLFSDLWHVVCPTRPEGGTTESPDRRAAEDLEASTKTGLQREQRLLQDADTQARRCNAQASGQFSSYDIGANQVLNNLAGAADQTRLMPVLWPDGGLREHGCCVVIDHRYAADDQVAYRYSLSMVEHLVLIVKYNGLLWHVWPGSGAQGGRFNWQTRAGPALVARNCCEQGMRSVFARPPLAQSLRQGVYEHFHSRGYMVSGSSYCGVSGCRRSVYC